MGLSCVLFVIISNYVGNIDTEHEARIAINHGQLELQLDYSRNYDEAYPENNLDTILTDNPLNDSMIEEIKSIFIHNSSRKSCSVQIYRDNLSRHDICHSWNAFDFFNHGIIQWIIRQNRIHIILRIGFIIIPGIIQLQRKNRADEKAEKMSPFSPWQWQM